MEARTRGISAVGTAICFAFQAVGLIGAAIMSFRLRAPSRDPQTAGARASAAANATAAERAISAVNCPPLWAQSRYCQEMVDERFISPVAQRDSKRPMTSAFIVVV